MRKRAAVITAAAAAAAIVLGGSALAFATGEEPDAVEGPDVALTGSVLKQASAAALDAVGGGTVTATAQGDDGAAYEVEITMPNGDQIDVELAKDFTVVAQDHEGAGESESADGEANDD